MIITLALISIFIGILIMIKGIKLRKQDETKGYKHTTDIILAGIYLIVGGGVALIVCLYKILNVV